MKLLPVIAVSSGLSFGLPVASWAGFFGDHPSYDHAITDLRTARHFLNHHEEANVEAADSAAIQEVDAALGEIKRAALDDWKDIWNPPPIDVHIDHRGRLHEALKLLEKAHSDVKQEEDDYRAKGLQHRALEHIDRAVDLVRAAADEKRMDEHY